MMNLRNHVSGFVIGAIALALASCGESGNQIPITTVQMHFDRPTSFFDAPFPSDDLKNADGTVHVSAFPNPSLVPLVDLAKQMVDGKAKGFASEGGVFFATTGAIDAARLPSMAASITSSSSVMLVDVTKTSADYAKPVPILVTFTADGGPFGAPNLIGILPLQGTPLHAGETYAAVVRTEAGVAQSAEMAQMTANHAPPGITAAVLAEYQSALAALASINISASDVAGLAVFTTADPTADFAAVQNAMLAAPLPTPTAAFHRTDLFDDFCVYSTTIGMPDYQSGTPPFSDTGGAWPTTRRAIPFCNAPTNRISS